ncbi:peptide transporter family 1-like [Sitodiplosis mosellana]|uniref:peptide transporter family 1-like n=1 Tax=Sitodiplosis mosellana TaxID=263140 RepID=UPI002443B57D|nr:peptide transporter family 1-like [Sitodiplosis mosellana]
METNKKLAMENLDKQTINGTNDSETVTKPVANLDNGGLQKLPYPKRIFLIVGNEVCERFNFYGMRAILAFYLNYKMGYTETDATMLFHAFTMMVYFACFFGGIVSDVWLGKFHTILYLSFFYSIGSVILSLSAIPVIDFISPKIAVFIGLVLIAIGSGGIKPCVSAFGADQFKLPEQAAQIATYFSVFYFSMSVGTLTSTTITPILRADVHCFGENDCYSLAFGVPAILMIISIVLFLIGKSSYTYVETSSENMIIKIFKCISHAIATKRREGKLSPRENLLDYSTEKYGAQLVNDIRAVTNILLLYLPLPIFWTVYNQKGSRWIFQGAKMNGDIGFYVIKPDQMLMVNPLLVLTLVPVFETVIYPMLNKIGIRRPLQKMTIGGILLAISFFLSAIIEFSIESSSEKSISILWQIPQFVILTIGEILFAVTGLSFSYEEASANMKSVVVAYWHLLVAFGEICFIFVSKITADRFTQGNEFVLFAVLMLIDMLIFAIVARNFKSQSQSKGDAR